MGVIPVLLAVLAGLALVYALAATVALLRSHVIAPGRKAIQAVFVWAVPLLGPMFVMHLIAEHEPEAIPARWTGSERINGYVFQTLAVHSRFAMRAARGVLEAEVLDSIGMFESAGDPGGAEGGD